MFESHLTLDLHSCNEKKLVYEEFIQKILDELTDFLEIFLGG
jgi:hypothetical protein